MDLNGAITMKESCMDLLIKISPKTRKSTTRSAKKLSSTLRPITRGSMAAQKITPFEASAKKEIKSPKKVVGRRSVDSQLRSVGTKRSFEKMKSDSVSSDKTVSECSEISIEQAANRDKKMRKARSKVEKLFMTEKKANTGKVNDPLVKKK
jgi:hypothetical protein